MEPMPKSIIKIQIELRKDSLADCGFEEAYGYGVETLWCADEIQGMITALKKISVLLPYKSEFDGRVGGMTTIGNIAREALAFLEREG